MSYGYTLTLATTLSAEDALNFVSKIPGFDHREGRIVVGPGIVVDLRTADEEDKEDGLQFEHFEPDLHVSLTHKRGNKDGLLEVDNVIRVTMLLLHHATGEAVLRADDALWLRLENNVLWLNSDECFWKEYQDLLPLITMPYRVAALPDATLAPPHMATA